MGIHAPRSHRTRPDALTAIAASPAAVNAARDNAKLLDLARPAVVTKTVDYSLGARAPWWPKAEAPVLAELVRERRLPPSSHTKRGL